MSFTQVRLARATKRPQRVDGHGGLVTDRRSCGSTTRAKGLRMYTSSSGRLILSDGAVLRSRAGVFRPLTGVACSSRSADFLRRCPPRRYRRRAWRGQFSA